LLRHDLALPVQQDIAAEFARRGHLEVADGGALGDFFFAGVVVDLDLVFGVAKAGIGDAVGIADVDDDGEEIAALEEFVRQSLGLRE
jgi:hypothetical protein